MATTRNFALINRETLLEAILSCGKDVIYTDRNGVDQTMLQQVNAAYTFIGRSDTTTVNYYHSRSAFSLMEMSKREREERALLNYTRAAHVILNMNRYAKQKLGKPFVMQFVHNDEFQALCHEFISAVNVLAAR